MKQLLCVLVFIFSSFSFAGEAVNKVLDAALNGSVRVDIVRGDVTIEAWDNPQVQVSGTLDDQTKEFIFKRDGDTIFIENKLERNVNRGLGAKVTIKVPRQSAVKAELVSADLRVSGFKGKANLSTVSGELNASELGEEIELDSVSGDIQLHGAGGRIKIGSVSGDIQANVSATRLSAESVSGDIKIENTGRLERASLESVSGDLAITSAFSDSIQLDAETVSGDITIISVGAMNAQLRLETGPGGDITNKLSSDKPTSSFIKSHTLNAKLGSGRGEVKAETVSGNIVLTKK